MFVIIFFSVCYKPFPLSVTNIKRIVNFVYLHLRFSTTCITNKKAHDFSRAFSSFFFVIHLKLSRFQVLKEKRKRFISICYNFSFSFRCSLGVGEKLGLIFRGRRYEK